MRVNREPIKNLWLINSNERCLKSRGPIRCCGRRGQLGPTPVEADALVGDLGRGREEMDVEAEKEDKQEKAPGEQAVEMSPALPLRSERHRATSKRRVPGCQEKGLLP